MDAVRAMAGWPSLQLQSLWMWDKAGYKQGESKPPRSAPDDLRHF